MPDQRPTSVARNCEGGLCQHCDKPAVVGLNNDWVCLDHFRDGLLAARQVVENLNAALLGESDAK